MISSVSQWSSEGRWDRPGPGSEALRERGRSPDQQANKTVGLTYIGPLSIQPPTPSRTNPENSLEGLPVKVTPRPQTLSDLTPLDRANFTGEARARPLMNAPSPPLPANAVVVRFDPGVRNYWHAHAGGQLLYVIEGEGWVQSRGQAPQRIRTGDVVAADPNEEHWHGAGSSAPMAHISVAIGDTRWLEPSPEPPA